MAAPSPSVAVTLPTPALAPKATLPGLLPMELPAPGTLKRACVSQADVNAQPSAAHTLATVLSDMNLPAAQAGFLW